MASCSLNYILTILFISLLFKPGVNWFFLDTIDHVSDSFFGDTARRLSIGHKDTGSKIVFGRSHSHSLINGSESSFSLSKADSDKVMFYSCNSIASLQDGNVQ